MAEDRKAWLSRADAEFAGWAAANGVTTPQDYEGIMRCLGIALEDQMTIAGWKPAKALTASLRAARLVRAAVDRARRTR